MQRRHVLERKETGAHGGTIRRREVHQLQRMRARLNAARVRCVYGCAANVYQYAASVSTRHAHAQAAKRRNVYAVHLVRTPINGVHWGTCARSVALFINSLMMISTTN